MVEHPQMLGLAGVDVQDRRVVAERDDLDALQPHDAVGLGPAPVVADAHADDRILYAPYPKTLVADVEIALFEVLERRLGEMLGVPRQVDLAVAPDDMPRRIDQDRRVVVARLAVFLGQLGIAEIEADAELPAEVEQWPRLGVRHVALEIAVDLALVGHPPARKERRQRQLGKDDKPGAIAMRLAQQGDQPLDHRRAAVGDVYGPELGNRGAKFAGHGILLAVKMREDRTTIRYPSPSGSETHGSGGGSARVARTRPTQTELRNIAEHVVARGNRAVFDPCDKIVEGGIALPVDEPAMSDRAQRALDQQMRRAGALGAPPVILLQPERDAEIRRLVERHHRHLDLPRQLGENRVRLARARAGKGYKARDLAIECLRLDAQPGIDVVADVPRIAMARKFLG